MFEIMISLFFKSLFFMIYFCCCFWFFDGNYIFVVNVVNGFVSLVVIIEWILWDSEINFIGYEGLIEVCMFLLRLFYIEKLKDNGEEGDGGVFVIVFVLVG